MSLFITSLNSGSNGNCYYIGNDTDAVLVDAGISCRETERRMSKLGLAPAMVKAIFVSHEHSDHITGIPAFSKKYQVPVYITPATLRSSNIPIQQHLVQSFSAGQTVCIGTLCIHAFSKSHDAADPHSFVVSCNNVHVGVFTDIGYSCSDVTHFFRQCHAVFLEANYCEQMLATGNYPVHLKKRISGKKGHLSNHDALSLFRQHRSRYLSHLLLSHLSKNNNSPEVVENLFREHAGSTQVIIASRYAASDIYRIDGEGRPLQMSKNTIRPPQQLSLFG